MMRTPTPAAPATLATPATPAALATALATAAALAGGCNAFLESYTGRRFAPTTQAEVVAQAPPESQAQLIGESAFVTTDQFQGDGQALEAARAVGAQMVQWDRAWAGQQTRLETMPIYQRGVANTGTFVTYVYLPESKSMWRYFARYWRLRAPGDAPTPGDAPAPPAPAGDAPAPPAAGVAPPAGASASSPGTAM
jgi:hypothetical protein